MQHLAEFLGSLYAFCRSTETVFSKIQKDCL